MESLHTSGNPSQSSGIVSSSSNNSRKRRKLKRMISSSDSDDEVIQLETPTKSNKNNEGKLLEKQNSNESYTMRTPNAVKKTKASSKEATDKRDSSEDGEKLQSRDEIRMKREMIANLNSLHQFYSTSQELKSLIQLKLNTNLDQYIGCIKPTQSFGDLAKFDKLKMFKSLKNYQQCGVHWLSVVHEVPYASAILADEMGLGKTVQVCVFLEYIYRMQSTSNTPNTSSISHSNTPPSRTNSSESSKDLLVTGAPHSTSPITSGSNSESANSNSVSSSVTADDESTSISTNQNTESSTPTSISPGITVVIVPLSVMNNWLREFETWTDLGPKVVIFHGNYKERMELLESILERMYNNEIYVIIMTLGMFKEVKILKHFEPFEYLIIDEAHSIKNPNTTMYRKLLFSLDFRHKLLLTGTPIQNTMDELCSLLQFAMPYVFESSKINLAINTMIDDPEYIYSIYPNHELLDYLLSRSTPETEGTEGKKSVDSGNKAESSEGVVETPLKIVELVDSNSELEVKTVTGLESAVSTSVENTTDISTSNSQGFTKSEQLVDSQEAVGKIKNELYTCINDIIERNMNKMEINEHLKIIQKLTTPFILRRLKRNVMNELPLKNSLYVPCEMSGIQLEIYQRFFSSSTLNTAVSRVGDSDEGENSCTDSDDTKYEMDNMDSSLNTLDKEVIKSAKGSTSEKMTYKIFQLRRICNHPLLVRGLFYTEEQIHEIAKIVVKAQSTFATGEKSKSKDKDQTQSKGKQTEKNKGGRKGKSSDQKRDTEQELEKMNQYLLTLSDFQIYNLYLSSVALLSSDAELEVSESPEGSIKGDDEDDKTEFVALEPPKKNKKQQESESDNVPSKGENDSISAVSEINSQHGENKSTRNPYIIEESLFFESTKINKMFDLLTMILKRNENVLIFSQFTSYLDIIEKCFELRGIHNYLRLDGSLNVKQKEYILDMFSSNKNKPPTDYFELKERNYISQGLTVSSNGRIGHGLTKVDNSNNTTEDNTVDVKKETNTGEKSSKVTISAVENDNQSSIENTYDEPLSGEEINVLTNKLDTGYRIMLISTKVGGIGLNLTRANNVILMDQSWNPHNDLQAEDRCHRIGQDKPVNIYKLFTKNSIEEHVIFKSTNKLYLNQLFNEAQS